MYIEFIMLHTEMYYFFKATNTLICESILFFMSRNCSHACLKIFIFMIGELRNVDYVLLCMFLWQVQFSQRIIPKIIGWL